MDLDIRRAIRDCRSPRSRVIRGQPQSCLATRGCGSREAVGGVPQLVDSRSHKPRVTRLKVSDIEITDAPHLEP